MLFKKYMSVTKTMIYQTIVAADYTKGQSLTDFQETQGRCARPDCIAKSLDYVYGGELHSKQAAVHKQTHG